MTAIAPVAERLPEQLPPGEDVLVLPSEGPVERIADAALRCIAHNGITATTVEAIAVEAGVGRATVYRHFPGGRAEVVLAAGYRELERFAALLAPECDAAGTLEDLLVVGLHRATEALRTSGPIQELLSREPEIVLPHLGFDRMPDVFVVTHELMGPHLRRFLEDEQVVEHTAELMTRLVLSHLLVPSADLDTDDPVAVREHVRRFVLPAVHGMAPPT
ncbi:MAG: helix-turn-helix domain-containing protein [Actinomycetota bacterium]